jgi:PAS domain S-box-containing protein
MNKELRRQIKERVQVEAALRESEEKYSTLVEDALIGVYIVQNGKIEFANQKFADIFGYSRDELIGMESLRLIHPSDRAMVKEIRSLRLRGKIVPSEYASRGTKKNGETIWVLRRNTLINYKGSIAISGNVADVTKRREIEEALRESENELRILSSQLLSAEEKERKRIARELHDGIGQALSAIKFGVENSLRALKNQSRVSDLQSLKAIIPLAQETIEDVRRIVEDLRPSILDDLGVLATIGWICRKFQTIYTAIRIKKKISIQEDEIPSPLKTIIYRVLQEALNNVAKHSKADLVHICLKKKDSKIYFAIEDNGCGFDIEKTISLKHSRRGLGLASMRERTELSGAAFIIRSVIGAGTKINISWPLRRGM